MTREDAKKKLTNTKVYVNGKSKEIQEKLFEIGISWGCYSGYKIQFLDSPFLFIKDNISYSNKMQTFQTSSNKEISADDIINIKIDEELKLKDGDIFYSTDEYGYQWLSIFNKINIEEYLTYADLCLETDNLFSGSIHCFGTTNDTFNIRLATEEEKNKLFCALKEKGYVWNAETKKVEKIVEPKQTHEFKPFDKVLVRNCVDDNWDIEFFQEIGGEDIDYQFVCLSGCFNFCVPYEGNEELLGASNSPKE